MELAGTSEDPGDASHLILSFDAEVLREQWIDGTIEAVFIPLDRPGKPTNDYKHQKQEYLTAAFNFSHQFSAHHQLKIGGVNPL